MKNKLERPSTVTLTHAYAHKLRNEKLHLHGLWRFETQLVQLGAESPTLLEHVANKNN